MKGKFFNIIPSQNDTACLVMYGPVGQGESVNPAQVVTELLELQSQYKKIDIRINSVGGEVFAGIAIFNALKTSTADITIYIDGVAASIAAIIALCGKPLYMSNHARLMLHRVKGGEYGTAKQLREAAHIMEDIEATLSKMIASRLKITPEEVVSKYFDGEDHWLTAKEAEGLGLIDGIYDINEEGAPDEHASNDDIYHFFTNRLALDGQHKKTNQSMAFIDDLKALPSFKNVTGEADMLQHISTLENNAAKVPALEAKVTELEKQLADSNKAAHKALLDNAVAEGKITQAQVPTFMSLLESDEKNTKELLNSMPKKNSAQAFIHHGGVNENDLVNMSWDEIDKANRLAELKNNYPELYEKKFNEAFKK